MRRRAFISLFGVLAAASSLAAHAQESATMRPTGTLPQIEVARVKPVHGEFVVTLRLASETDRGNGTAKRSGQGRHGRVAVCQIVLLECCH
jgi:hypothetical protein